METKTERRSKGKVSGWKEGRMEMETLLKGRKGEEQRAPTFNTDNNRK